jgi:hypothetical protein
MIERGFELLNSSQAVSSECIDLCIAEPEVFLCIKLRTPDPDSKQKPKWRKDGKTEVRSAHAASSCCHHGIIPWASHGEPITL